MAEDIQEREEEEEEEEEGDPSRAATIGWDVYRRDQS